MLKSSPLISLLRTSLLSLLVLTMVACSSDEAPETKSDATPEAAQDGSDVQAPIEPVVEVDEEKMGEVLSASCQSLSLSNADQTYWPGCTEYYDRTAEQLQLIEPWCQEQSEQVRSKYSTTEPCPTEIEGSPLLGRCIEAGGKTIVYAYHALLMNEELCVGQGMRWEAKAQAQ